MNQMIWTLLASVTGTAGFCILFHIAPRHLPLSIAGGMLTCGLYLLLNECMENLFLVCMCSAVFATLYAECMARLRKAPATVYLIPAIITLIPGGMLYYTMQYLVIWNREKFMTYGLRTAQTGLGIAVGIMAVTAAFSLLRSVFPKK